MDSKKRVRLVISNKLKNRQIQRFVIAGSLFSLFGFFCALMYINFGVNSDAKAGIAYTWNGSTDSLWSNATNWTPNGVPVPADDITIPSTARIPVLDANINVNILILSANAQIDFNGFDLTVASSFTSNTGTIVQLRGKKLTINGTATLLGGTINENIAGAEVIISGTNTVFGNASGGPTLNSKITVNSGRLTMRNSTFNGVSDFTKNNTGADACVGNNIFNAATSITNTSTANLTFSNTTRDQFHGQLVLNSTSSGILYMAYNGVNTLFNDSVWVNSSGTGGVRFGSNNGTSTLASGKTIRVGASGFSNGTLQLRNITFNGSEDQDFQLTGTGILQVGPATTFNGNVNSVSAGLVMNGATFNGQFTAVRNGSVSNTGLGGNVFNGITQITNSGTGNFITSSSSADIFNAVLTLNSTNTGNIYVAYAGIGSAFNDNVYVNSTSTGGVRFGLLNGTSTVAAGKNILVGGLGFNSGTLLIAGVNMMDASPKSFLLGTTATLTFGPNTQFNGDVCRSSA